MTISTINGVPRKGSHWSFTLAGDLALECGDSQGALGLPAGVEAWPPEANRSEVRASTVSWRIDVSKLPVSVETN
ncbi:MAG: hypothetical protein O2816_17940 [Planctomycetota bacterium]|nr:hypothetical protein [Planctomycetota bacterium]